MNPKSDQLKGIEAEVRDQEIRIVTLKEARIRSTTVAYVKSAAADETGMLTHLKILPEIYICNPIFKRHTHYAGRVLSNSWMAYKNSKSQVLDGLAVNTHPFSESQK